MDTHKHYICTGGCEAVSDTSGTCGAATCTKQGQPFSECDCTDGKHHKAAEEDDKEEIL